MPKYILDGNISDRDEILLILADCLSVLKKELDSSDSSHHRDKTPGHATGHHQIRQKLTDFPIFNIGLKLIGFNLLYEPLRRIYYIVLI